MEGIDLDQVYAVLGKRNSKILSEEMKAGSEQFLVRALIPVTDSFGFNTEIRRKSSGLANPQLIFSHWGVIHGDPFWVPATEEVRRAQFCVDGGVGERPAVTSCCMSMLASVCVHCCVISWVFVRVILEV